MQSIKGFVSYTLIRTDDGGSSVTVCQDQAGLDEGARLAKQWIATNASSIHADAPVVSEGPVFVHLSGGQVPVVSSSIPLSTVS